MAYILPNDLRSAMRKLPSSITDLELEKYIEKATAYLNGMLGKVYVTPFGEANLPPLIRHLVMDLAVFFLSEDLYTSQQPNMDDYQEKRWERVSKMIEDILSGELVLDAPLLPPSQQTSAGFASTNEVPNIFTIEDPFW